MNAVEIEYSFQDKLKSIEKAINLIKYPPPPPLQYTRT